MLERRETARKGEKQVTKDAGKKEDRKRGIQESRAAQKRGIQESRDAGNERFTKGGIQGRNVYQLDLVSLELSRMTK